MGLGLLVYSLTLSRLEFRLEYRGMGCTSASVNPCGLLLFYVAAQVVTRSRTLSLDGPLTNVLTPVHSLVYGGLTRMSLAQCHDIV